MTDKIKSFMEYVSSDETLKAEMQAELENTEQEERVARIIQFAKKHGHDFTEEEFALGFEELNDDELEAVAGSGKCICPVYGSGEEDGLYCVCLGIGYGGVDSKGFPDTQGGCLCTGAGVGATRRH